MEVNVIFKLNSNCWCKFPVCRDSLNQ